MTTHQTPPSRGFTELTWASIIQAANDSAATDPVQAAEAMCPHYAPRGLRRWLWHVAAPIGELQPGEQAITSRSGTAYSRRSAIRKRHRVLRRHVADAAGRDPYGWELHVVRRVCLALLVVFGFALVVATSGCSPSVLAVLAMAVTVVGAAATLLKGHRARARHR